MAVDPNQRKEFVERALYSADSGLNAKSRMRWRQLHANPDLRTWRHGHRPSAASTFLPSSRLGADTLATRWRCPLWASCKVDLDPCKTDQGREMHEVQRETVVAVNVSKARGFQLIKVVVHFMAIRSSGSHVVATGAQTATYTRQGRQPQVGRLCLKRKPS